MLRIVAILHNPAGSTGHISNILQAQQHEFRVLCPLAGDPLPEADSFDAAIVFGGKMSANDCNTLPELLAELLWIRSVVESGKPFLGICLGAQLLAMAYGGKITRHAEHVVEIGYYHLYPTVEGFSDIFADMPERFFQWHNEGFTLPEGAVKLAASDAFPNQAFRSTPKRHRNKSATGTLVTVKNYPTPGRKPSPHNGPIRSALMKTFAAG